VIAENSQLIELQHDRENGRIGMLRGIYKG